MRMNLLYGGLFTPSSTIIRSMLLASLILAGSRVSGYLMAVSDHVALGGGDRSDRRPATPSKGRKASLTAIRNTFRKRFTGSPKVAARCGRVCWHLPAASSGVVA